MANRKRNRIVVGESDITALQMKDYWTMVDAGLINGKVLTYIKENIHKIREMAGVKWWEDYLLKEEKSLEDFFGKKFDLSVFGETLQKYGLEQIRQWQSRGFEVHFLPDVLMSQTNEYQGWKIKPQDWYYKKVAQRKIFCQINDELKLVEQVKLNGQVVLIDNRLKPSYKDGKQMFFQDTLIGGVVAKLRQEGKIAEYQHGDQTSRFGVSAEEWQEHIRPALAKEFGVETNQVRLETAIEANVIPQLYPYMPRKDDGKTDTWIWYEEYFKPALYRLYGGNSDYGGLSVVSYDLISYRWSRRAFRPLVVLT